jgi:hypothetical protein
MDPSENAQIVQVAGKLVNCRYSIQMFYEIKIKLNLFESKKSIVDVSTDPWNIHRLTYYQEKFFQDFGDVMSYFHKKREQELFDKLNITDEDRNNLKRLRDVISHITDWDKSEAAWKDHPCHSLTGKYVDDCVNVSDYFFKWFYQINKDLASRYQEILKAIDAPFQENLRNYFQKQEKGTQQGFGPTSIP